MLLEQLGSSGFNRALPTNEGYLNNIKPYFAMFAGITYTLNYENASFDIGVSGYRFVKTNKSVLNDPNQFDPARYNFHANFQTYISERLVFNANALYVNESNLNSYTVGMNFGNVLDEKEIPTILNIGLWYRGNEAIIPYFGLSFNNLQAGITYDVPLANSNTSLNRLKTFEFSLIFRSPQRKGRTIPCPWK